MINEKIQKFIGLTNNQVWVKKKRYIGNMSFKKPNEIDTLNSIEHQNVLLPFEITYIEFGENKDNLNKTWMTFGIESLAA